MHIFQFPQRSQQAGHPRTTIQSPNTSTTKQSTPPTTAALLEDDDASDYDHLSPLHESKGSNHEAKEAKKKHNINIYSDKDIDEALNIITKGFSGGSTGSPGSPPREEVPPAIPPKKHHQGRNFAARSDAIRNVHQSDSQQPTSSVPVQAQRQPTYHTERKSEGNDTRQNAVTPSQIPPPVPPKMRRKKQQVVPPSGSQPTQPASVHTQRWQDGGNRISQDNVFPPSQGSYADGHTGITKTSPPQSHASTEDDPMSSVSNTTLVEQEDATLKGPMFHTKSSSTAVPVYPATSQYPDSKQSRSVSGRKDKIVKGAEDSTPPVDKRMITFPNQFQSSQSSAANFTSYNSHSQFSQGSHYHQDPTFFSESRSQPDTRAMNFTVTSHYGQQRHGGRTSRKPEEKMTVPTVPHYKISLESAFTEGNVMKGQSYAQPKHSTSGNQSNERLTTMSTHPSHQSVPRSNSVGQTSRQVANSITNASPEEQKMRQRFYSGGKLPMEKPVVHGQSQSVTQLLRELEISDKKQPG